MALRIVTTALSPLVVSGISIFTWLRPTDVHRVVLRQSRWDGQHDKETCRSGTNCFPSVTTACYEVSMSDFAAVHEVVTRLDHGLGSMEFPVEGLLSLDRDMEPEGIE